MSQPQHIPHNTGGAVSIQVPVRPAASQTVSCYTGAGAEVFSGETATLTAINTTLTSSASRGDRALAVNAGTNIVAGSTLWITAREQVLVKSISGTDVTLVRPLMYSHASGATVQSHTLSYSVSATQAATLFWDGRLEWLVDDGEATEALYHQPAICAKYELVRFADEADWFDEEPLLYDILDPNSSPDRQLQRAWDDVAGRLASLTSGRAWTYVGATSFIRATIYAAQVGLYRRQSGDGARELYERYQAELQSEIEKVVAGTAWRDENQDGAIGGSEQRSGRSMRLIRG